MSFSVIFDLDGTIVNNAVYHKKAWQEFCSNHQLPFSDHIFNTVLFGKTNQQTLPILFNRELAQEEILVFSNEKEIIYRKIFQKEIKPVEGLIDFLNDLQKNEIPIGLATSAPPVNIELVLSGLNLKRYFRAIVDDTMVSNGKPDPEIFIRAANEIGVDTSECVVFEDSLAGTKAAYDAGCKVVAITTTIQASQHKYYHYIIQDFSNISVNFISQKLF